MTVPGEIKLKAKPAQCESDHRGPIREHKYSPQLQTQRLLIISRRFEDIFGWPFGSIMPVQTRSERGTLLSAENSASGTLAAQQLSNRPPELPQEVLAARVCVRRAVRWLRLSNWSSRLLPGSTDSPCRWLQPPPQPPPLLATPNGMIGHLKLITNTFIIHFNSHEKKGRGKEKKKDGEHFVCQ